MRFSSVLAASLLAPLVAAHGGIPGAPKVYGLPNHLRARNPFAGHQAPRDARLHDALVPRQGGTCGPSAGGQVCNANECCSPEGYCGIGIDYCAAPDCQIDYGPACDANQTPAGASTRNDARPQLGNVAYGGAGIYSCAVAGEVALTFDDGPYIYTTDVLDILSAAGVKATFFITGNNLGKGSIDTTWNSVIQRMETDGHQIASHTWSHQDLNNITESQVYDQMVKNEMALRNILGKYPTYMRPPYSDCGATCQNVMSTLGYHVIFFDVDTDDYDQDSPSKIQVAKDNFKNGIDSRGAANERLVIAHDIHEQTAHNLTAYMLSYLASQNLTPVTVGQCLGDAATNWYRQSSPAVVSSSSTRSSSAPTSSPTGLTSPDGSCGGANGYSCIGFKQTNGLLDECCSSYGYCGSDPIYCGTGCQAGYGKCGVQSVSTTSTAPAPTATVPSTDGSCGGIKGSTCAGYVSPAGVLSECCSSFGYCGNTTTFCGTGCQGGYGKCLGGSSSISSTSSTISLSSASSRSSGTASSTSYASTSASSGSVPATSSTASRSSSASSSSVRTSSGSSSGSTSGSVTRSSSSSARASSSGSSSVRPTSSATTGSASVRASSTPASSGSPSVKPTSVVSSYAASSVKPSSAATYPGSSFYTAVKPSSTVSAYAATSPSPSAKVSKDGKCGTKYGAGQTCAGYKNSMGTSVECCCADSGTCSNDSYSCGQGCDKAFGNCWGYY